MNGIRFVPWTIGGPARVMASVPATAQKIERKKRRSFGSIGGVDTFKAYCVRHTQRRSESLSNRILAACQWRLGA